jgi:hypothetical protein
MFSLTRSGITAHPALRVLCALAVTAAAGCATKPVAFQNLESAAQLQRSSTRDRKALADYVQHRFSAALNASWQPVQTAEPGAHALDITSSFRGLDAARAGVRHGATELASDLRLPASHDTVSTLSLVQR